MAGEVFDGQWHCRAEFVGSEMGLDKNINYICSY